MGPTSRRGVPDWATKAIPLPPNRVSRFYRGGAQLDTFRGATEPMDADRPEDWVGSVTEAWRRPLAPATDEGLTRLPDGALLRDLLEASPEALVGEALAAAAGVTTGLLVKLLDAAERLPVHCHPTRAFARRVLGSAFGKTEAWVITGTRRVPGEEPPNLRLGFTRDVPAAELRGWIETQRIDELLAAMHLRPAVVGEAWLVPAGLPHAIGAGVFLIELQEPTDFSVVAETDRFTDPDDASLGRGWDVVLDCFDRRGYTTEAIDELRSVAAPTYRPTEPRVTPLVGAAADPFFRAGRLSLPAASRAAWPVRDTFAVVVVTAGAGEVRAPRGGLAVRAGDTFAVPAAASGGTSVFAYGGLELVLCMPPDPARLGRRPA